jgi:hypothetical protein
MALSFSMVLNKVHMGVEEVNVFHHMVMPNVNVRRVDMSRLMDKTKRDSMHNDIMADAKGLREIMPNLETNLYMLMYKFTYEGPGDDKASLFSCMGLAFNTK